MSFGLGMLADAAAAHGFGRSPSHEQPDSSPMSLAGPLPFIASSRSALTNWKARVTPSRPLSAGSDGTVVRSPTFEVLEDPSSSKEDQISSSATSVVKGPARPGVRKRKSTATAKTSFQIAHPPPAIKHRQRLNIRPKVLLQLQQISEATRPRPILDVLPSVVFAPRLARKFPSVFKGKDGLGADDLVVVTSQNYDSPSALNGKSENVSEDDSWAAREIVAAICQPKKRGLGMESITEICLNHGPLWEASLLPNGAYEFVSTDEDGHKTVARWVPRPPTNSRRSSNGPGNSDTSSPEQRKFTFSIINPDTRRHPVIATLTRASIDIWDRYTTPSSNIPANGVGSRQAQEGRHAHFDEGETPTPQSTTTETDDQLRSLIVITGIFVAFREGYSPNFHYEKQGFSSPKPRSLSINLGNLGGARTCGPESPPQQSGCRNKPTSENMSPISSSNPTSPMSNQVRSPPPERAHSTGAAFLKRANSRRPFSIQEAGQTSPVPTTNGIDAGQGSPPHRRSNAATRKESGIHNGGIPNNNTRERLPPDKADPHIVDPHSPIDNVQRPSSTTTKTTRKPSRLTKLFRCLRRASGAH
ncbi:hypothetical protein MMC07_004665 [Pseudocyphellaria aurata]|nr:hypothetical protein [Pseudocyphellaria aurata]